MAKLIIDRFKKRGLSAERQAANDAAVAAAEKREAVTDAPSREDIIAKHSRLARKHNDLAKAGGRLASTHARTARYHAAKAAVLAAAHAA